MSVDLGTQIRDYAQAVDTTQEPLSLDEITDRRLGGEPVRPIGLRPYPVKLRPRRRWLVAVAAAAAVLVVVGGAALLSLGTGADSPPAAPSVVDPASSLIWSQVRPDAAVYDGEFEQWMFDVVAGGPGLVAVGHVRTTEPGPEGDPLSRAAVWTSPDGVSWSRVHGGEVFYDAGMTGITAWDRGFVAVGDAALHYGGGAAVWTSPDGFSWSRVPLDETVSGEFAAGPAFMGSVTPGGPGLVAVGAVSSGQGAHSNAVVWTSEDGIEWSRVPHDDEIFGRSEKGRCCTGMSDVTAGGPGLVAVGADWLEEEGTARAVVWTSHDGISWSRVRHDEETFGGASMSSVTVGGPGLVAVGSAVWTSVDGLTWARVPYDEEAFGGAGMGSVTVGGPGLVAVGSASGPATNDRPDGSVGAIWTSVDGITWSRVPHDESVLATPGPTETFIHGVTSGGPGIVVVGVTTMHASPALIDVTGADATVWVATPEE